jgi:hypothetical protein
MVALFVTLAALSRLLDPRELTPRQHAAELLGKSDDGWSGRRRKGLRWLLIPREL